MRESTQAPSFLITIDTEGDNLWGRPQQVGTRNAEYLPRFQALCERFGFKPTYLTNNEMALAPAFQELGREALKQGTAEIGMHLHAWDSPPLVPLTDADHEHHPYLIDYAAPMMREKIAHMTDLLEDIFSTKMRSHRAGRWAFNETYAELLLERGYCVDCSVTPGHSWGAMSGAPGKFGTDYTHFPDHPYFIDPSNIAQAGKSSLLELPVTIRSSWLRKCWPGAYKGEFKRFARRMAPELTWLRPNGGNLNAMLSLVDWAERRRLPYIEFMIHSSEFMPGGSPYFKTEQAVTGLYADLERLFDRIAHSFKGQTLSGFHDDYVAASQPRSSATGQGAATSLRA